ncbi:hypothetical protein JCM10450v2_003453 [Rhodotorula kratochvilovae]
MASHPSEQQRRDVEKWHDQVFYSARYSAPPEGEVGGALDVQQRPTNNDEYEYRHVILPKALVKYLPKDRLAEEDEWRSLGIRQSPGWWHYERHSPEPHIMLFKRKKEPDANY